VASQIQQLIWIIPDIWPIPNDVPSSFAVVLLIVMCACCQASTISSTIVRRTSGCSDRRDQNHPSHDPAGNGGEFVIHPTGEGDAQASLEQRVEERPDLTRSRCKRSLPRRNPPSGGSVLALSRVTSCEIPRDSRGTQQNVAKRGCVSRMSHLRTLSARNQCRYRSGPNRMPWSNDTM